MNRHRRLLLVLGLAAAIVTAAAAARPWWSKKADAAIEKGTAETTAGPTAASATPPPSNVPTAHRNLLYPEVAAAARAHGSSLETLLQFAARQLRNDPYPGALRGPRGTLLAGAGSSADKALLLRDLVRLSMPGAETRLAIGVLPQADAAAMASEYESHVRSTRSDTERANAAASDAKLAGLDEKRRLIVERVTAAWAASTESVRDESRALQEILAGAGVQPQTAVFTHEGLAAAVRTHVWLQVRQGTQWIDLDSTLRDTAPGKRRTDPQQTVSDLPRELEYRVAINLRLEERTAGELASRLVLQTDWATADLAGSTISFGFAEPLGLGAAAAPAATEVVYTPVLLIDDERRTGTPVVLPRPPRSGIDALAGGLRGMLGGANRSAPGNDPAAPELTAIWLELTVQSPDGRKEAYARPIADRIGYAARHAPNPEKAPLASLAAFDGEYTEFFGVTNITVWMGEPGAPRSLLNSASSERRPVPPLFAALESLGTVNRTFHGLRVATFAAARGVARDDVIPVSPNISLLSSAGGSLTLDLLENRVQLAPEREDQLSRGLLWAQAGLQAERLTLRSIREVNPADSSRGLYKGMDVSAVFAQAKEEALAFTFLKPGDADRASALEASDEARARLRSRLAEGWGTIVPDRAVTLNGERVLGWWLVKPSEGWFVDEMENGRHQSTVETPAVNAQGRGQTAAAREGFLTRFGRGIRCLGVAAQLTLGAAEIYVGVKTGDPNRVESGIQNVFDGAEGINPSCSEGDAGMPRPPAAGSGPGPPDPPPLPRIKK